MELPFVFGVIDDLDAIVFTGQDPHRQALMKQIQQAWTNIARTGDPSQPSLPWPSSDEKIRVTMELGISPHPIKDPKVAERKLWSDLPFDGATPNLAGLWAFIYEN